MCVLVSSTNLAETFPFIKIIQCDFFIIVCWSSYKVPLFLSDFNETVIFSRRKNFQISNFMKILPLGAELFRADGLEASRFSHDLKKKVAKHKTCVLIYSTNYVWNISHSKKNWTSFDRKCLAGFM
jgi:hypothetical protein